MSQKASRETKIRNRNNQVPHLTQDTTWKSDETTIKDHTQESQKVSSFPVGDNKATMNKQESMTNKNIINKNNNSNFITGIQSLAKIDYIERLPG